MYRAEQPTDPGDQQESSHDDGADEPEGAILGIAAGTQEPLFERTKQRIRELSNQAGPPAERKEVLAADRPVGGRNDERTRKSEQRNDSSGQVDLAGQDGWRFSSRYQVRPPT